MSTSLILPVLWHIGGFGEWPVLSKFQLNRSSRFGGVRKQRNAIRYLFMLEPGRWVKIFTMVIDKIKSVLKITESIRLNIKFPEGGCQKKM